MALSNEEKQIIQFGQANDKSSDEIMVALTKFRTQSQAPTQGVLAETGQDILETFKGVGGQFREAGERIAEIGEAEDLTFAQKARGQLAETFRGGARAFGEAVIGAGKAVLPQRAEEAISRKVQEVGGKIGETKFVQNLVSRYQGLSPDVKREVDIALGFGEGLAEILAFGKVIKPAITAAKRGVEEVVTGVTTLAKRATPQAVKNLTQKLTPKAKVEASKILTDAYESAFVADNASMNKALNKLAAGQSFGNKVVTKETLIKNLVDEGITPSVKGKLSSFDDEIVSIIQRQNRLAEAIDPLLDTVVKTTSLSSLKTKALKALANAPQIVENLPQARRQLENFFKGFEEKFGDTLTAKQVNEIRKTMNSRTKAFGEEAFKQDTANVVAGIARTRIDELVPSGNVRTANAEWGRLQGIRETAELFNNKKVKISELGEALGRWTGVVTLGASGVGFAAGGPGGLVIASLAAKFGGDAIAQFLRSRKFSQQAKDIIIQGLKQDDEIVQKLINEASEANKDILKRTLLPERTGAIELPQAELGTLSKKKVSNIPTELQPLAKEARKFGGEASTVFAPEASLKNVEEFINAHRVFHGGDADFIAKLRKTRSFKPGAVRDTGTGGNLFGLSTSKDFSTAKDFSTSATGNPEVIELFIHPKAKTLNLTREIDDLSISEIKQISKNFDVVRDVGNLGGEGEVRILNPSVLRLEESQIENFFNLVDLGIEKNFFNKLKSK